MKTGEQLRRKLFKQPQQTSDNNKSGTLPMNQFKKIIITDLQTNIKSFQTHIRVLSVSASQCIEGTAHSVKRTLPMLRETQPSFSTCSRAKRVRTEANPREAVIKKTSGHAQSAFAPTSPAWLILRSKSFQSRKVRSYNSGPPSNFWHLWGPPQIIIIIKLCFAAKRASPPETHL